MMFVSGFFLPNLGSSIEELENKHKKLIYLLGQDAHLSDFLETHTKNADLFFVNENEGGPE